MSTQMRGFAPATRVMSRREPPAAPSGSWPSTRTEPAWLRTTFASACGRWLVIAISRSCARRVDGHGDGAQRGDEPVQEAVALRLGLGDGRQEPRRAVEELLAPARGAARLRAAHRVAADEAHAVPDRSAERGLRRADVGHGGAVGGGRERFADALAERRHRRRDDREIRVLDRRDEAVGRLVQRAALGGDREELGSAS